jgi:hypothetical protein
MNNTRNSVFRNLPTNYTSLRLKLAFAPKQNYQQSGIAVYQDDDNYVFVDRVYNGGNKITCSYESAGNANILSSANVTATNNMVLRLDRNATNGAISAYYSLNGTTWVSLGSLAITLNNPRLGIFVGSSPGGLPNADYAWAEILAPLGSPVPALSLANEVYSIVGASDNRPVMMVAPGIGKGTFSFEFETQLGVSYVVEYKCLWSDPSWTLLTNVLGTGSSLRIEDPVISDTSRFYRVRVP